ncbi:MAG: hypothetical protein ACLUCZ_10780 [Thomasclavelia ramosa]
MKCNECKHLISNKASNRGRSSIYYCSICKGVDTPVREISRIRGPEEIPTKTSPRWCSLKGAK